MNQKRNKKWLDIAEYLFLILLLAAIVYPIYQRVRASTPRQPDLERVSQLTGIKYPSDAKLMGSYECKGVLKAAVQFKRADAQHFSEDLLLHDGCKLSNSPVLVTGSGWPAWWNPSKAKNQKSFLIPKGGNDVRVLIDLDRKDKVVVYLLGDY